MSDISFGPFPGVYPNPAIVSLGEVVCPPYDVVSKDLQHRMYGHGLRNVIRIEAGYSYDTDVPGVSDRYTRARDHLASWRAMSVLLDDDTPHLYALEHRFTADNGSVRQRRGVVGGIPAKPWDDSPLLPHERTMKGPIEDRTHLMRVARVQPSPIMALSDAPTLTTRIRELSVGEPLARGSFRGERGTETIAVWRLDEGTSQELSQLVSHHQLFVADGHHRYETVTALAQREKRSFSCLAFVCGTTDPGLEILPTHRVVSLPGATDLVHSPPPGFTCERVTSLDAALTAIELEQGRALALHTSEGTWIARWTGTTSSPVEETDAWLCDEALLAASGVVSATERTRGAVSYHRSVEEIEEAVRQDPTRLAVAVGAASVDTVLAVAQAHLVMPQKSTYFHPKVPAGVVMMPLPEKDAP